MIRTLLLLTLALMTGCATADDCPVPEPAPDGTEVIWETGGEIVICRGATEVTVRPDGVDCAWHCAKNGDEGTAFWGLSFRYDAGMATLDETTTGDCI